uniref:Uncharacterized protein n=1 Tax=Caenorhabditis japonica TaxID=281687 RepID=A0A8R1IAF0_CAEJA
MVSEADRIWIVTLSNAGHSQADIHLKTKITIRTIQYTLERLWETGVVECRIRTEAPATAVTPRNIKVVKEKVRRNPMRSMGKLASEMNISADSVHTVVNDRVRLRPIKMQPVHALNAETQLLLG